MKKIALLAILGAIAFPTIVSAAWWNPPAWKPLRKAEAVATSTEPSQVPALPSTEELLKRIAELEDKLDKALSKKAPAPAEAPAKPAPQAEAQASGLTEKQVIAKAKPAIVSITTATTTSSGAVIDSKGHVIVSAQAVLIKDSDGAVTGAAEEISAAFSDGAKKKAVLVGIDETRDVAVYKISGSVPYISAKHGSGLQKDDKVYVFAAFDAVAATISQKSSNTFEAVSEEKPSDRMGAVVNSRGEFVGIPRKSSCKVIEEGEKCLAYKVTSDIVSASLSKMMEGMRLYKDKKGRTSQEIMVGNQLAGVYKNTANNSLVAYSIAVLTDKNSFDYVNDRLVDDQDGKITKIYLNKLKVGADSLYKAFDFLKSQSHNLDIFFINESVAVSELGDYQKKIAKKIEADNKAKFKEYQAKVSYWSKKKNEYDSHLANPSGSTHAYLMEEGMAMEAELKYLLAEQKRIVDSLSSETLQLF
jgi:hypothetical protein